MKDIVLITGASSGIGRETALKYAKNEHPVIIICKNNRSALMDLEQEILEMGGRVLSYVKDVSQFNEVSDMFRELETQNMIPDILINNAGISYVGLLQDMSHEEWRRVIDTNLTSAFMQYAPENIEADMKLVAGRYPEKYNELVVVLNNRGEISELLTYSLGFHNSNELNVIYHIFYLMVVL